MSLLISITLFALGAIIASFVGVLVGRLHTGEGFVKGRSRCDACNVPLPAHALIPIFSYFLARGRARCCGARISISSSLTELLLGALFVLVYVEIGLVPALPFMLVALAVLLALVLYDLAHQILPPVLLTIFVALSAVVGYLLSSSPSDYFSTVLLAAGIAIFLALIHFLSRGRAMGLADAPLVFGLSLLVGPAALPGFIFSFWIGAVFGIALLLKRPRGSRMGVEVPFAPYLAAGFLLAYFTQWNPFIFIAVLS